MIVCIVRHHPTKLLPGFTPAFQKLYMTFNTILWSVLGTTLATITSRVTYGLRQQVAEANELGQYILEEKIGGGGMGEVWRARHRLLIRPAAIKLIRPRALGPMPAIPSCSCGASSAKRGPPPRSSPRTPCSSTTSAPPRTAGCTT